MQDNLLTYPFVKKGDFEGKEQELKELREKYNLLYAELNGLKELFDSNLLDLNKLIQYGISKDEKSEEVKEIKKRLKDVSSIEKLSQLTSDNIKLKVELNNSKKIIGDLNKTITELQMEIKRMMDEQQAKDNTNRQMIFKIRNIDEMMKDKLKSNEELESKNKQLMELNKTLIRELTIKARKLGYIGEDEQKPLLVYSPQDNRFIARKISKIKKLINARFIKGKKMEKAKGYLFDVKQSIALMPEESQKQYKEAIRQFDEVLNG